MNEETGKYFFRQKMVNGVTGRRKQVLTCAICQMSTMRVSNMRDHIRSHLDLKPYECLICGVTFAQSGNRDRHQRNHHKKASSQ